MAATRWGVELCRLIFGQTQITQESMDRTTSPHHSATFAQQLEREVLMIQAKLAACKTSWSFMGLRAAAPSCSPSGDLHALPLCRMQSKALLGTTYDATATGAMRVRQAAFGPPHVSFGVTATRASAKKMGFFEDRAEETTATDVDVGAPWSSDVESSASDSADRDGLIAARAAELANKLANKANGGCTIRLSQALSFAGTPPPSLLPTTSLASDKLFGSLPSSPPDIPPRDPILSVPPPRAAPGLTRTATATGTGRVTKVNVCPQGLFRTVPLQDSAGVAFPGQRAQKIRQKQPALEAVREEGDSPRQAPPVASGPLGTVPAPPKPRSPKRRLRPTTLLSTDPASTQVTAVRLNSFGTVPAPQPLSPKKRVRDALLAKAKQAGAPVKVQLPDPFLGDMGQKFESALPVKKKPVFGEVGGTAALAALRRLEPGMPVKKIVPGFLFEEPPKVASSPQHLFELPRGVPPPPLTPAPVVLTR